ncbi:uncharacterized protein CLUP02_04975 [Colletotrichum lupini]|uniref:Uncharacterized protein n=1 Tax=Colletotrichum lupini TaxID=145971 RepID=A0A9Q8SM83_9PEZI|nr:uncharacterized protein CLUP02_04975 [Colletotrichum lupini]UQC79495.1 hypothetical protein CLUP02_04975 [Colletotrichum lupini]
MKSPMPAIARVLALFRAPEYLPICYHIGLAPTLACLLPAAQPSKVTKGGTGVAV